MKIFAIRHGETQWNASHKVQGRADIALNETGIQQAMIAKQEVEQLDIDIIICSPLIRAKQTAEILNRSKQIPIIFEERLMERDFGEFEGLPKSEFDFETFWSYTANMKYKEAENIREFFLRISQFLDDLQIQYPNQNILLVTHAGYCIGIECYFDAKLKNTRLLDLVIGNCKVKQYC